MNETLGRHPVSGPLHNPCIPSRCRRKPINWDASEPEVVKGTLRAVDEMSEEARARVLNDAERVSALADDAGQTALYSVVEDRTVLDGLANGHPKRGIDMAIVAVDEIRDIDRDSVHILPLMILPLTTKGLKRTRMVKNLDLKPVIEIFDDDKSGSGQMPLETLHKVFSHVDPSDMDILRTMSQLYSFDVFCLRIQLRNLGIEIDNADHLKLSQTKQEELAEYMKQFTQRLILEVLGSDDEQVKDYNDITALFHYPDVDWRVQNFKPWLTVLELICLAYQFFLKIMMIFIRQWHTTGNVWIKFNLPSKILNTR